jgi:hypothetical protein
MFTNDLFKEIDFLIDEKSLCVKAYTGMFEERLEEIVFKENISFYSVPWREEDSPQWRFMEPIKEDGDEWEICCEIFDTKEEYILKIAEEFSKHGDEEEYDNPEKDDGIIILGNKLKSIRI